MFFLQYISAKWDFSLIVNFIKYKQEFHKAGHSQSGTFTKQDFHKAGLLQSGKINNKMIEFLYL